jgi:hypothetical protein
MQRIAWSLAIIVMSGFTIAANTSDRSRDNFPEVQKEAIQKTLNFSALSGPKELVVDNVFGSIQVTGYEGKAVQVEIDKTSRGRTQDAIALANKEVELKISEKGNRIELYVDGPFRCQDGSRRSRHFNYQVNYDFRVKVPRECDLHVSTITDGDLRVENVAGKFDLENVNGKIQMSEVSGSGYAHTVNGTVKVLFSHNPTADCSFKSLNGDVDVALRPNVSADFWFKTFNGGAYTDFDLTSLPQPMSEPERRNGKYVYKSNRFFGARAGKGGPQIKLDSFNGNIHVTSR